MKKSKSKFSKYLTKYPDGGKITYEKPEYNPYAIQDNTKVDQSGAWLDEIEPKINEQNYLKALEQKTGEINVPQKPRSTASKAWGIATNPMTYLSYKAKGIDVPEHFEREGVNKLDYAANILNPFAIANSVKNIPSDIKKGEYLNAGLGAMGVIPQSNIIARGLNEGAYIGKQLKKSASLFNKTKPILPSTEEFSKLRNISKVSALAQESTITRPQLINRYLKSGLDEKTLKNLTGKTIKELEDELKNINNISTEIKDSKSLSPNWREEYLNQERTNNLAESRSVMDDFRITPERREEILREWRQLDTQEDYWNNITNTLRNPNGYNNYTAFINSRSNPIREDIDKVFNNLNSKISTSQGFIPLENSNSKSLLSSLFKGSSGKNKDIVDEMRSAESKLRNSPKGVYQTTSNLSDNSFTNQLPFYSKLENEGDQFNLINHGYVSTNQASYLAQAGVSGEDRVKYINGVIDSYNKGRKLKIPYAKINGEDVQIPNLSIKKNYKDGGWLDQL